MEDLETLETSEELEITDFFDDSEYSDNIPYITDDGTELDTLSLVEQLQTTNNLLRLQTGYMITLLLVIFCLMVGTLAIRFLDRHIKM